jgi:hypothetical protein
MDYTEMIFKLPKFEIKNFSENDFLFKLMDTFELITPVLSDLLQGKEIITNFCIYRIKL